MFHPPELILLAVLFLMSLLSLFPCTTLKLNFSPLRSMIYLCKTPSITSLLNLRPSLLLHLPLWSTPISLHASAQSPSISPSSAASAQSPPISPVSVASAQSPPTSSPVDSISTLTPVSASSSPTSTDIVPYHNAPSYYRLSATSHHHMTTRASTNSLKPKVMLATKHSIPIGSLDLEPKTYLQAKKNPQWQHAMQVEYDALLSNGTWDLVPRPLLLILLVVSGYKEEV